MKKCLLPFLAVAVSLLSLPAFSQDKVDTTDKLGLAGDNLDLYAVLTVFQNSKTIEAFEKSLNDEQTKINNLDLNLDKKIDFIKVTTPKKEKKEKNDSSYTFVLQVDVTKTETQDVAVILLNKENGKVTIQMVGDPELYGKDYVIEPKGNSPITPNPAYKGPDPVTVTVEAPATSIVVQQAPIVQYVYSPAYVPYYPPYYYGYYPGWFAFSAVVSFGIYAGFHSHYHGGYYGGHYGGGNTVIINNGNRNNINHYNNSRNTSNTVANNKANGGYGSGNRGSANRPSTGGPSGSTRPSAGTSNRPSTGGPSGSTRPSAGTSNRPSTGGPSSSTRPSTSNSSGRTRSSGGYSGGGGGGFGGGGMRGGGGGGRRR